LNVPSFHPQEECQKAPELVTSVGAAGKVTRDQVIDCGPRKNANVTYSLFCKGVEQERFENGAEPMVCWNIEALFGSIEDASRYLVTNEFSEEVFE